MSVIGIHAGGGFVNGRPSEHAGDHHLLHQGKGEWRVLPQWVRVVFAALHRLADDHGDRAWRYRVNPPVNGGRVQDQIPFCGHEEREAGRAVERGAPGGGESVSVVLFQRRRRGFRDHDCKILTRKAQGVAA